jgi:outer membrane protein assembly factor BamB
MGNKIIVFGLLLLFSAMTASAQQRSAWRGPERDGIYPDTGLLRKWPEGGPEVLWTIGGLGQGYSSPSFANGKIYLTGMHGETGHVFVLGSDGERINSYEYGPEFHRSYPGSRSTPLVVDNLLYLVSGMGRIMCLEAETGREIWSRDAIRDFGGENIRWGITENLLIDGDRVFFAPGGKHHNIVALDRFSGDIVWSSPGTGKGDLSAYCSPLIVELPGRRLLVTHMASDIVGLDAETGKFLWSHPFDNRNSIHANTPIFRDGCIYAFSTDESGSVKLRLISGGSGIEVVWENREVNPLGGGAVIVNDHIFTSVYVARRWHAMDIHTGESTFSTRDLDRGIVIYADGMLYCYSERGELALVRPNPEEFEIVSSISIDSGSGQHFAHPVIHGGKLFVRRGDGMIVLNISSGFREQADAGPR